MSDNPLLSKTIPDRSIRIQQTHAIREEMRVLKVKSALQAKKENEEETNPYSEFARIIRDGVAEEVRNLMLTVKRELDQHRKAGRFSKNVEKMRQQFIHHLERFTEKKEVLEKLERAIDILRNQEEDDNRSNHNKLYQAIEKARKIRDELVESAETLLKSRERIDRQMKEDRRVEKGLHDALQRCLNHLSQTERGKMEVKIRKLQTYPIDARQKALSSLIEQLAEKVPAIRIEEIQRLYEKAKEEFNKKNFHETLQILNQLFKFDRKHLLAHRLRVRVFQLLNNKIASICELKVIVEFEDAEGYDFYTLAEALSADGHTDEAYFYYEKAALLQPEPQYLERFADLASVNGHWYRAIEAYKKMLAQNRHYFPALHKLGRAYFEYKKEEEAYQTLKQAIETEDSRSLSQLIMGQLLRRRCAPQEALNSFKRAVELDAHNAEAYYWLGLQYYDAGEFSEALIHAMEAVSREPDRVRNTLLLARCYEALGKFEDANEVLEPIVLRENPPVDALLHYSEIARKGGFISNAREMMEHLFERYSHLPMVRTEYGLLLLASGEFQRASQYLHPDAITKTLTP